MSALYAKINIGLQIVYTTRHLLGNVTPAILVKVITTENLHGRSFPIHRKIAPNFMAEFISVRSGTPCWL